MVVVVLSKAGDHDPIIPLSDIVGKADKIAPLHIAAIGEKVGVTSVEFTVIVIVVEVAH